MKRVLRKYGLCLRHFGMLVEMVEKNTWRKLPPIVLIACTMPRALSPAGHELQSAITYAASLWSSQQAARSGVAASSGLVPPQLLGICAMARGYAARGCAGRYDSSEADASLVAKGAATEPLLEMLVQWHRE